MKYTFNTTRDFDLMEVAKCHRKAFSRSLSTWLGIEYCQKMLEWYIKDNRGDLFHINYEGRIIGYCGTMLQVPGLPGSATSITQYTFKKIVSSIILRPWVIFHPEIVSRIPFMIKNIFRKLKKNKINEIPTPGSINLKTDSVGLVVIGVIPEFQHKGIGSLILIEFERRAREHGATMANLSVKKNNKQAISSYKRNGWVVSSEGANEYVMSKVL